MAINPDDINTKRVGELPSAPINLSDKIPHEIGTELFQTNIQSLADFIKDYIGTVSSLAFNPTTVPDGGTLPVTDTTEWILVGVGTFHNAGGAPDIVTTEELNALTSNGLFWRLAVEIPINVELAGIVQTIRSGFTQTAPSENTVYNALNLKLNVSDLPNPDNKLDKVSIVTEKAQAYVKRADGNQTMFNIAEPTFPFIYGAPAYGGSFDALPFDKNTLSNDNGSVPSSFAVTNSIIDKTPKNTPDLHFEGVSEDLVNGGETSNLVEGSTLHQWYRLVGETAMHYRSANNSTLDNWTSPVTLSGVSGYFPTVFKYGATYYMFANPTDYITSRKVLLYSSTDKINWSVMNSGNSVIAVSSNTTDWHYTVYNIGVCMVGNTIHILAEGTANSGFYFDRPSMGYATADISNPIFTLTSTPQILDSGNAQLIYVPEKNSLLTLHGRYPLGLLKWQLECATLDLSANGFLSESWVKSAVNNPELGDDAADFDLVFTPGKAFKCLLTYNHSQKTGYRAYNNYISNTKQLYESLPIEGNVNRVYKQINGKLGLFESLLINGNTPITGSGSIGKVPKFTGTNTLGDGAITDNVSYIGINTVLGQGVNIGSDSNGTFYDNVNPSVDHIFYSGGGSVELARFKSTGEVNIKSLEGSGKRTVVADASGNLSATDVLPTSNTYNPIITAVGNSSALSAALSSYVRNGNIIIASIRFSLTETSALGLTQFSISLPVKRTTTNGLGIIGNGCVRNSASDNILANVVFTNANNSTVLVNYKSGAIASNSAGEISFQYSVLD